MLVLKSVINKKFLEINTKFSVLDKDSMKFYRKDLNFEVLDTKTNKRRMYNLDKLEALKVLRVEKLDGDILCYCISDNFLKLLDYIDSPKVINENVDVTFSHRYSKCNELSSDLPLFYNVYTIDRKVILVINLALNIYSIDSNFIFWKIGANSYYSIFDIYNMAFDAKFIDENTDVYFTSLSEEKSYKLDINKDVIRFMIKLKTLRK